MSYTITQQHRDDFQTKGFVIFEKILPDSLLTDLRLLFEGVHERAYSKRGDLAQRFTFKDLNLEDDPVFQTYRDSQELNTIVKDFLSEDHDSHCHMKMGSVLINPKDLPNICPWHRDWRYNNYTCDKYPELWHEHQSDLNFFNQINLPLYDDSCTWIVPGSHHRPDTPEELEAYRSASELNLNELSYEERERACLDHCRSMPGAMCAQLRAGDLMLYRNTSWHLGNYLPYQKRVTLHDIIDTEAYHTWRKKVAEIARTEKEAEAAQ